MRTHYSAAELAGLRLAGLPGSIKGIKKRLGEHCPAIWRRGRGGQEKAYAVNGLPPEAQADLIHRAKSSPAVIEGRAMGSPERAAYIPAAEQLRQQAALRVQALEMRAAAIINGWSAKQAEVYVAAELGIAPRTLRRWQRSAGRSLEDFDAAKLVPKQRGPAKSSTLKPIHPEAWQEWLSDYLHDDRRGIEACRRDLIKLAAANGWGAIPSADSLARRLAATVSPMTIFIKRYGMKRWAQLQPSQRRDKSAWLPLEWVNGDGHRADVFVQYEDGSIGRPLIAGWQDMFSGKILSWRIAENETTDVIRRSFVELVRTWGAPENVMVDNGLAYAGKQLAGGVKKRFRGGPADDGEPDGLYKMLGCSVHFTKPYNGRAKPIERFWQEFVENVSKAKEFRGAYTGPNPTAKPEAYGSRAVPIAAFRARVEQYVKEHNARPGRQTPICGGKLSLDQAFESKSYIKRVFPEEQLIYLELPSVRVSVPASGQAVITPRGLGGNRFWHVDLTNLLGREVVFRYHPEDFSRGGYVYLPGSLEIYCRVGRVPDTGAGDAPNTADEIKNNERARAAERKAVKAAADLLVAKSTSVGPATVPARHSTKVVRPKFKREAVEIPGEADRLAAQQAREQASDDAWRKKGAELKAELDAEYGYERAAES